MNNMSRPSATLLLATAILGLLALFGCGEPTKTGPDPNADSNTEHDNSASDMVITPVDRTIVDNRGRSLDVRILARSGTHARMIRQTDGLKFDLPISDLREEDQRFINRIPETPIIGSLSPEPKTNEGKPDTPPYIKNREESIAKLKIKAQEQNAELKTLSIESNRLVTPRIRMKEKEMNLTNSEILRLQGQIDVYRSQNQD